MIVRKENPYGIDPNIEELIRASKPFVLTLRKGSTIYERCFTPIGNTSSSNVQVYRHEKNGYEVINTPSGEVHRLKERKSMPSASTINKQIYENIRILELSGYALVPSANWKVI